MNPIRPICALALASALSACTTVMPVTEASAEDTCGAASFQSLIGQDVSPVFATTLTTPIRVIRPDDVVTMEFQAERLNFRVDANEIVQSVTCG